MKGNIQEIIACLDKYLSESDEKEIGAVEGNFILEKAGLLADRPDRPGAPLRILLREGKIPHAYQQDKRWKIPHSKKCASVRNNSPRKKSSKTISVSNKKTNVYSKKELCHTETYAKRITCPECRVAYIFSKKALNSTCSCGKFFDKSYKKRNRYVVPLVILILICGIGCFLLIRV